MPTYHDRNLGPGRIREDANDHLYPPTPTVHSILSQRRRAAEQRQIDAARAKAAQLQAERAALRKEAEASHAEREEQAFKEQALTRYIQAGGREASFYQIFPQLWREELARRVAGTDEATRSGLKAKYAF